VKDTVAVFADAPARQLSPGKDRVTVKVFAIDSRTPATNPRLKPVQTFSCPTSDFATNAIVLDRSQLRDADMWRLVIMLPQTVVYSLDLGKPQARSGARWDRLTKHGDEYEEAFVRWKVADLFNNTQVPNPRLVRDHLPASDAIPAAIKSLNHSPRAAAGLARIAADLKELSSAALLAGTDSKNPAFLAALENFPAGGRPPIEACQVEMLEHASDPDELWMFGAFDLPTTDVASTIPLPMNGVTQLARQMSALEPLTAWATYVPRDVEEVQFLWAKGPRTTASIAAVLGAFVSALAPVSAPVKALSVDAEMLLNLTAATGCEDLTFDYPLTQLAHFRSVVSTSREADTGKIERDTSYTVYACNGPCVVAGDKATSLAQGTFTTPSGWGLTLLGAITYDFRLSGTDAPFFTQYQWVPATASSGTQLFELRQVRAPLQSFSSSLFLTLRFPDPSESVRFAIGAGPTILFGDGSGKLSQWTANLFLSPGSTFSENKLYLTAGIGFRLYNRPVGANEGDVVQSSSAPTTLVQQLHAEWVATLGLAIDLSVLGDAASAVFGAKAPAAPNTGAKTGGSP
jgi:hypothetical protein